MDGQQYLNQISSTNKPQKIPGGKSRILHNKFFIVGMIGLAVLIVIIILGAILGNGKDSEKTLSSKLSLHLNSTAEVIQEYQNFVRSSTLRSSSASLYGVLTNTSSELNNFLLEKYNIKKIKDIDKPLQTSAEENKKLLSDDLFEAKINGILDRIYAHKMAYEITTLITEENRLQKATNNESLKTLLDKSRDSLDNLYANFNDFSETKN